MVTRSITKVNEVDVPINICIRTGLLINVDSVSRLGNFFIFVEVQPIYRADILDRNHTLTRRKLYSLFDGL